MDLVDLVIAARAGDRAAFGTIVRRFQDMAFGGAYAWLGEVEDARDAAQDAFIEAWESLSNLREPEAFPGWFRRILAKRADRIARRRPALPVAVLEGIPSPLPDPSALMEAREVQENVQSAISMLPESQRLPLTLFHLDGYSQKEVAAFLELPVSTVKKRIFDARNSLQERMSTMVKKKLDESKPSRDDTFVRKVEYFVAVRDGDAEAVSRLLDADASLLTLEKVYEFSLDEHMPHGMQAVTWAAMTNDVGLLTLLLDRGADVETPKGRGEGLLHTAVMADAHDAMRLLLQYGADVDRGKRWQRPLHRAAMRGDRVAVDLLLEAGADLEAKDQRGRTPADWAALKGRAEVLDYLLGKGARKPDVELTTCRLRPERKKLRTVPAGDGTLERFLDPRGKPVEGGSIDARQISLPASIDHPVSPILETGIKVIDLFAPIRRGGHAAISGGTGVGVSVVLSQVARNLVAEFDGRIVFVSSPGERPEMQFREWQTMLADGRLLGEHTTYILAHRGDTTGYREAAETGAAMADSFRQEAHEVLLILDNRIACAPGVLPFLRTATSTSPQAAVTTLYLASIPDAVPGDAFHFVDTVIRLDGNRASDGMYPAVDPVRSTSRVLDEDLVEAGHCDAVARARDHLGRYYEHSQSATSLEQIRPMPKARSVWHTDAAGEDDEAAHRLLVRCRRLDFFLTQPFHCTELWIGEPGEIVPV